jgi:hypothetical protein
MFQNKFLNKLSQMNSIFMIGYLMTLAIYYVIYLPCVFAVVQVVNKYDRFQARRHHN